MGLRWTGGLNTNKRRHGGNKVKNKWTAADDDGPSLDPRKHNNFTLGWKVAILPGYDLVKIDVIHLTPSAS